MSLILCMETATEWCSVVVAKDGLILGESSSDREFDHTAQLTLLIEDCLHKARFQFEQLDAIAVSIGPGSYTSLRTGLSTAKGLCYGLDLPLLPINALSIIAQGAIQEQKHTPETLFVPMIDARRMEVYSAVYDSAGAMIEQASALILDQDSFASYWQRGISLVFAGNGAPKFAQLASSPYARFSSVRSHATYMPTLAEQAYRQQAFADLAYIEPMYIKPPNITSPKKVTLGL